MRTHILYAYQTQTICVPEQVVCISSMSDMRTINVYAYRTQTICIPEQVVHISDTDNICIMDNHPCLICVPGQIVLGTHIGHKRYAYNKCVCISDTNDMHTRAGSMHIRHRNVYAYHTWTICV